MNIIDTRNLLMIDLKDILATFEPVSLEETDRVKLMNRVDVKFVFSRDKLPVILEQLLNGYRLLEINGVRLNRYESLYYDTEGFGMYLQHHNGKLNRFKVRKRMYVDSGKRYFEIKFKNNKGRTIKERIKTPETGTEITESQKKLLIDKTTLNPDLLKAVVTVNYSRMTFVEKNFCERVTIDVDPGFSHAGKEKPFPNLVIAEVKQERSKCSQFQDLMHRHQIESTPVSKYCLGIISLNDGIKKNRFKPKLIQINKINHETI
jgi:hypothetical protein